jgi:hypothetical protein
MPTIRSDAYSPPNTRSDDEKMSSSSVSAMNGDGEPRGANSSRSQLNAASDDDERTMEDAEDIDSDTTIMLERVEWGAVQQEDDDDDDDKEEENDEDDGHSDDDDDEEEDSTDVADDRNANCSDEASAKRGRQQDERVSSGGRGSSSGGRGSSSASNKRGTHSTSNKRGTSNTSANNKSSRVLAKPQPTSARATQVKATHKNQPTLDDAELKDDNAAHQHPTAKQKRGAARQRATGKEERGPKVGKWKHDEDMELFAEIYEAVKKAGGQLPAAVRGEEEATRSKVWQGIASKVPKLQCTGLDEAKNANAASGRWTALRKQSAVSVKTWGREREHARAFIRSSAIEESLLTLMRCDPPESCRGAVRSL